MRTRAPTPISCADLLEGQGSLEPRRISAHLKLGYPLDPSVSPITWSDEPQGKTVPGGERLVRDVGGQEKITGLLKREAASVAGRGPEQEAARAVLYPGLLQQRVHRHPAPALARVPAAGAVEGGLPDGLTQS